MYLHSLQGIWTESRVDWTGSLRKLVCQVSTPQILEWARWYSLNSVGFPETGKPDAPLLLQVLSLLAFICEEVVSQCTLCGGLYFFEFVSCSAFLLSLLILVVYCTPVYDRVDPAKVKSSVSTRKHNPCDKNEPVFGSCVVVLFTVVALSQVSQEKTIHCFRSASKQLGFPAKWGGWEGWNYSDRHCQ